MTTLTIKTATGSDADPTIAVVVLAFSADPVARWAFPDPQQYIRHFPSFVSAFAGKAFTHDSAYCVDGYAGAALWLPPDIHPDEDELIALVHSSVAAREQADLFAVLEQMGRYHPREPHWYLPLIGVDPARQGKGYGSALLQHSLLACDRHQLLAYLEATNLQNRRLYERHGFELMATIQVGASPPLFPMLRKPQ